MRESPDVRSRHLVSTSLNCRFQNGPRKHGTCGACRHGTGAQCSGIVIRSWSTSQAVPNLTVSVPSVQNLALNIAEKGFTISVMNRSYEKTQAAVKRAEKSGMVAGISEDGIVAALLRAYDWCILSRPQASTARCTVSWYIDVANVKQASTPYLNCHRISDIFAYAAGLGDKLHGFDNMKDFVASLEKPRWVLVVFWPSYQWFHFRACWLQMHLSKVQVQSMSLPSCLSIPHTSLISRRLHVLASLTSPLPVHELIPALMPVRPEDICGNRAATAASVA